MIFFCEAPGCDDTFTANTICPADARAHARAAQWTIQYGAAGHGWMAACPNHTPPPLPGTEGKRALIGSDDTDHA